MGGELASPPAKQPPVRPGFTTGLVSGACWAAGLLPARSLSQQLGQALAQALSHLLEQTQAQALSHLLGRVVEAL